MKALSIRQPWAWAIVNGFKPVENRDTNFVGGYRGEVLIHAGNESAGPGSWLAVKRLLREEGQDPELLPDTLPLGGFVGMATIVDVVTTHPSAWFEGPYGIVLAKARPINLIRWPGQLGLFNVDPERIGLREPQAAGQGQLSL